MARKIKAGTTSFVDTIFFRDTSVTTKIAGLAGLVYNTAGLTCYYKRSNGTAAVLVSLANITTLGTYVSGGFKKIDDTNQPGLIEFHPPDAALAAGAKSVDFFFRGATNMEDVVLSYELDTIDYQVANGKLPTTLASSDVTGNIPSDLKAVLGDAARGTAAAAVLDFYIAHSALPAMDDQGNTLATTGFVTAVNNNVTTLLGRLTNTRAVYLDNLAGGAVATFSQVQALRFAIAATTDLPLAYERPDSVSSVINFRVFIYAEGSAGLADPDSNTVTASVKDSAGNSLNANLGSTNLTRAATGEYTGTYTVPINHPLNDVHFRFDYQRGGVSEPLIWTMNVQDYTAGAFGPSDRTILVNINNALPPTGRVFGTNDYTAPPTAVQVRTEIDNNSTQLATLVTNVAAIPGGVWGYGGGRTLTSGANIVLAKGTGITGFNDIAASDVWAVGSRTITGGTIGTITGLTIANVENMAGRFLGMIVVDGPVYKFTANALEEGPAGEGGAGSAQNVRMEVNQVRGK